MGREGKDSSELRSSTRSQGTATPDSVSATAPGEVAAESNGHVPFAQSGFGSVGGDPEGGVAAGFGGGGAGSGGSTAVASVTNHAAHATTDQVSAKMAAAGYPRVASLPPASAASAGAATAPAAPTGAAAAGGGMLPSTITTATAPLAIMRAMDEKAMYREAIEPLPQPNANSVSLPGAFPCHSGHNSNTPRPPTVRRGVSSGDNSSVGNTALDLDDSAEEFNEDTTTTITSEQQQQGTTASAASPPAPASVETANTNGNRNTTNSTSANNNPEEVSTRHLPIAAELVEDHETTRLQEMEAQLRREFEQRMQDEYIRRSQLEALALATAGGDDMDGSGNSHALSLALDGAAANNGAGAGPGSIYGGLGGSNRTITVATVEAAPVKQQEEDGLWLTKRRLLIFVVILLILLGTVIGIVVGVAFANHHDDTPEEEESNNVKNVLQNVTTIVVDGVATVAQKLVPVLQSVRTRGMLRCKPESLEAKKGVGFTLDLCRAIAAAIFNNASQVEFPYMPFREHFGAVTSGELDVSASHVSVNMGRDVREVHSGVGYTFSTPYLYTGTGLAGVPNFVQCAQEAETFEQECRHLQVCVMMNTVTQDIVEAHLPGSATKLVEGHGDLFTQFANGTCNVIAGDMVIIYEQLAREAGYRGEYEFADQLLSHEHLALLTRQDDPEWADFVDWILRALITAEALNITQETAQSFGTTDLFGPEYENMFIQAIAAVGNYGELYERHYGGTLPRSNYNGINMGETGLIVSDPLGTLGVDEEMLPEEDMPKPIPNGTIEAVINRGYLLCGVILEDSEGNPRPGFAELNNTTLEWSGIDVDYCRGMAAAVSSGKTKDIVFVNLSNAGTRYKSLANKTVDVIAGERFSMVTDVKEPTTGEGFTFATPYFYDNAATNTTTTDGGARAILTRPDDRQWSDLAKWVTHATFYAEEKSITQNMASEMPVVELFGSKYKQMLRDVILAVGNYGEIYARNLEPTIPRGGRNLLNVEDTPQFYPIIPFETAR